MIIGEIILPKNKPRLIHAIFGYLNNDGYKKETNKKTIDNIIRIKLIFSE